MTGYNEHILFGQLTSNNLGGGRSTGKRRLPSKRAVFPVLQISEDRSNQVLIGFQLTF